MIGLSLLIPIVIIFLTWVFFRKQLHWLELIGALLTSYIVFGIGYLILRPSTSDFEYNGHLIVKAEYYEEYETWVSKTCTRTYTTGSGKNMRTHTRTYDCSYCDRTSAKYYLIDEYGNSFSTDQETYNKLKKKWNANPIFTELNRRIRKSGFCGKDGDKYTIHWNKNVMDHYNYTTTHRFDNPLLLNRSLFNHLKNDSTKYKRIFKYPELDYSGQVQTVIGLKNINLPAEEKIRFSKYHDYLNAKYGFTNQIRIHTIFYKNEDISIAREQESYYMGGKQNEIIVCVGTDGNKIQWVYPISWSENKVNLVNIREDLMVDDKIDISKFYQTYDKARKEFKRKDFTDFEYISYVPSGKDMWIMISILVISTIIILIVFIKNHFHHDSDF